MNGITVSNIVIIDAWIVLIFFSIFIIMDFIIYMKFLIRERLNYANFIVSLYRGGIPRRKIYPFLDLSFLGLGIFLMSAFLINVNPFLLVIPIAICSIFAVFAPVDKIIGVRWPLLKFGDNKIPIVGRNQVASIFIWQEGSDFGRFYRIICRLLVYVVLVGLIVLAASLFLFTRK